MGRTVRNKEMPHPKPVEKIELSEKNIILRIILTAVLLVIGISSILYGIQAFLQVEDGWTEIHADSSADTNVGNEFVFMYNLGTNSKLSATAENKAVISLYTDVMVEAYELFHNGKGFENVNNIYYINNHPNEEIAVDDMLYQAFSFIEQYENRNIYLAPIYAMYNNIFYCEDDAELVKFDPFLNEELAALYKQLAGFAADKNSVHIELLGNGKVKLCVSEEYLKFCEENEVSELIDFSWMKNAFVVDYVADTLISKGFTAGTISSYDGFSRNLDESGTEFSFNIYDKTEGNVIHAATMEYSGAKSIVTMRNYPMNTLDAYSYYELDNGEVRTRYLSVEDGLCKSAADGFTCYAENLSCSEILLQMIPLYISDNLEKQELTDLAEKGIYSIFCDKQQIMYNEKGLKISDIYENDKFTYIINFFE